MHWRTDGRTDGQAHFIRLFWEAPGRWSNKVQGKKIYFTTIAGILKITGVYLSLVPYIRIWAIQAHQKIVRSYSVVELIIPSKHLPV